jgi:hypothetical protein
MITLNGLLCFNWNLYSVSFLIGPPTLDILVMWSNDLTKHISAASILLFPFLWKERRLMSSACWVHPPFQLLNQWWITLIMEAVSSSETSFNIYQTARCYVPEDNHLHTCRRENLKSHFGTGSLTPGICIFRVWISASRAAVLTFVAGFPQSVEALSGCPLEEGHDWFVRNCSHPTFILTDSMEQSPSLSN